MPGFNLTSATNTTTAEDEGTVVHIRDAAGDPMLYRDGQPVTITVAGTYSSLYRKAENAFNAKVGKRRGRTDLTDILEARGYELAAACVLAWDGFFGDAAETKALAMTPANAEAVFRAAPWLFAQVWEAMNDHAGFFKPGSSS